ncbi:MAG: DUF2812 domain-containing protein [Eubacteriales bacterium]
MKKRLPVPFNDTRRIEQYFNEMSKEGYHVINVENGFAVFELGKCIDYDYKILPSEKKEDLTIPNLGQNLDGCAKAQKIFEDGYSYVCSQKRLHLFKGNKEEIREIYEQDDDTKISIIKLFIKSEIAIVAGLLVGVLLFLFLKIVVDKNLIYTIRFRPKELYLFVLIIDFISIRMIIAIKDTLRAKKEKNLPNDKIVHWKKKSSKRKKTVLLYIVTFLLLVFILIYPFYFKKSTTIEKVQQESEQQVLRLEDIEDIEENEDFNIYKVNIESTKSIITSFEYNYSENMIIERREDSNRIENAESNINKLMCALDVKYYELRNRALANHFYTSYINEDGFKLISLPVNIKSQIFDYLYISKLDGDSTLAIFYILNGSDVWVISYSGDKSVEEVLEDIERIYGE